MKLHLIEIYFDGGCKPTNPGNKYGSFQVWFKVPSRSKKQLLFTASRISLGWGTSNEAEFDSLIEALKWVTDNLAVAGLPASRFNLMMFTDSTILTRRLNLEITTSKSEAQQRMTALSATCRSYLSNFKSWNVNWHNRHENVRRFGH